MHEAVEILKLTNTNITKINFMTFAECRGISPTNPPRYASFVGFCGDILVIKPPSPSIIIIIDQRKLIIDYSPGVKFQSLGFRMRPLSPNKSRI